jgi:hypothetical protein
MSGHWGGLERPIAWCSTAGCGSRGARVGKGGKRLCKGCRARSRPASRSACPVCGDVGNEVCRRHADVTDCFGACPLCESERCGGRRFAAYAKGEQLGCENAGRRS